MTSSGGVLAHTYIPSSSCFGWRPPALHVFKTLFQLLSSLLFLLLVSNAHPRAPLLVFRRVAMRIQHTTCWAFQHFNHGLAAKSGEPAKPTSLLLLMPIDGPNQLKFGSSDWHGSWHYDGNRVLHISFNIKGSGYTLNNSTLFRKDAKMICSRQPALRSKLCRCFRQH